jgi:hypothetical protein
MITQKNMLFGILEEDWQRSRSERPLEEEYMVSANVSYEKEFLDEVAFIGPEGELKTPAKEYVEY